MHLLYAQQITFYFHLIQKANFRLLKISQKRENLHVIHLTLRVPVCLCDSLLGMLSSYQKLSDSRDMHHWLWQPQPAARQQSTHAKRRAGMACCEAAYPAAAWGLVPGGAE